MCNISHKLVYNVIKNIRAIQLILINNHKYCLQTFDCSIETQYVLDNRLNVKIKDNKMSHKSTSTLVKFEKMCQTFLLIQPECT